MNEKKKREKLREGEERGRAEGVWSMSSTLFREREREGKDRQR
jgi:hypothetical protein